MAQGEVVHTPTNREANEGKVTREKSKATEGDGMKKAVVLKSSQQSCNSFRMRRMDHVNSLHLTNTSAFSVLNKSALLPRNY